MSIIADIIAVIYRISFIIIAASISAAVIWGVAQWVLSWQ